MLDGLLAGVNIGTLIQVFVVVGGLFGIYYTLQNNVSMILRDIEYLKMGQKTLNDAFVQLGNTLTKVAVQDARLTMVEKSVDEIRHGEGFIRK